MSSVITKGAGGETVVAIIPSIPEQEVVLSRSVTAIELEAESTIVETDEDYQTAAEFGRKVKRAAAEVTEFFRPMKDNAHRAHRTICEREKEMLRPLKNAEILIKRVMGEYVTQREHERRIAEAIAKRIAQEEAELQLEEALRAEESGDLVAAEAAMQDAQMADNLSRNISIPGAALPKADGITQSKDWEIVNIDDTAVPINIAGINLRPVDLQAVMRLIRMSKGSVEIPGVTYREVVKTSIRR